MKLSTILKSTSTVRIEIIDNEENEFYTFYIDYTKMYGGRACGVEFYDAFEYHGSTVTLPKKLLSRDVRSIDINNVRKALQIRLK